MTGSPEALQPSTARAIVQRVSHGEFYRGLEAAGRAAAGHVGSAAAALAHDALQPLLTDTPDSERRACRRGCSHCCHFPVGVTFAEAARLADAVRSNPSLQRRVVADAAATATLPWSELAGRPCPLLAADGACEAYAARPLPCRALASLDANACQQALGGDTDVPVDAVAFWRGLGAARALATLPPVPGTRELRAVLAAFATAPPPAWAGSFRDARPAPGSDEG